MATFDDMVVEGKVTIYDKGFDETPRGYGEWVTRSGDIVLAAPANRRAIAGRVPGVPGQHQ